MYRITSMTKDGRHSGVWRVMDGDHHAPTKLDNPNVFFDTKRAANARVRDLNN